jgi:hypothetical protein
MHTREQTNEKTHCGRCSQCVGRRFATLASRYAKKDPEQIYNVDLLTGERDPDKDVTLVESFIRTAVEMKRMSDGELISRYAGEFSRVVRHVAGMSADQVAENIVCLHRKHAAEVSRVMCNAISAHSAEILDRKLPRTCAIMMAATPGYNGDGKHPARNSKDSTIANPESHPREQRSAWMSRYSANDEKVYKLVGENNFRLLTNEDIGRRFTRNIRSQLGRDISPEALRACLNRVRRYHRLPKSWNLQRNPVNG